MSSEQSDSESSSQQSEQFKILTKEIEFFKSTIADMKDTLLIHESVVQEFLHFAETADKPKKSRIITQIKEQIRIEILEDVLRQYSGPLNKINLIEKQFDHFASNQEFLHGEIDKDFKLLQNKAGMQEEETDKIKEGCTKLNNHIANIYKELNARASVEDVCKLQEIVPTLAPLADLEDLKEKANQLASKTWVADIDKRLRALKAQVDPLPTMNTLDSKLGDLENNINAYISRFAEKTLLDSVADTFSDKLSGLDHRIESTKNKLTLEDEMLSKRINGLKYALEIEPWQKDVKTLTEIIDTKAFDEDLKDFKHIVVPKLGLFENRVTEFSADIRKFEQALARFDEIITTKGSKQDIELIQIELTKLLVKTEFDKLVELTAKEFNDLKCTTQTSKCSIDSIIKELDNYAISSKAQMKKNREISRLKHSVEDLYENMKIKAEKTEIHYISSIMATKDDISKLQDLHENLYNDFEHSLVLQTETLKSMLESAETPVRKNKVREELYNNANCLMNTHLGLRARTPSKSPNSSGKIASMVMNHSLESSRGKKTHYIFLRSNLRSRSKHKRLNLMTPELK